MFDLLYFLSNIIDDEEELPYISSISPSNDVLFSSIIDKETVIKVSMQIPEEFREDWMDTSDKENMQV